LVEVLIAGNPNAGKTTLFNSLTGARLSTGNWQGVTVKATSMNRGSYTFTDVPGTFTLNYLSLEEKAAVDYILSHRGAAFINAVDSFSLRRSLKFTSELIRLGIKPVIALTKLKSYKKRGKLSLKLIEDITGCVAVDADDITYKNLPDILNRAKNSSPRAFNAEDIPFFPVRLSIGEKILLNPAANLAVFAAIFLLTFFIAFGDGMAGERLKNAVSAIFTAAASAAGNAINSPIARGFICDCLISGAGGVLSFLPQIAILYFSLIALEDSGIMSYFAYMMDDIFSAAGLSGRAIFSILLGFGCTSAAMCSARSFSNNRSAFTAAVAVQYVPCSARLPVLLTLLSGFFKNPFFPVVLLYALSIAFAIGAANMCKGEQMEDFILELPVLRAPNFITCAKSLIFQLKQFIIKVAVIMLAFVAGAWLLKLAAQAFPAAGNFAGKIIVFLFYPMGITDPRVAFSALSGIFAKENIAGTLNMFFPSGLNISFPSAVALSVFVMLSPPCISAFSASCAQIGKGRAIISYAVQLTISFLSAYAAYLILMGGVIFILPLIAVCFVAAIIKRFLYERIHRKRKYKP